VQSKLNSFVILAGLLAKLKVGRLVLRGCGHDTALPESTVHAASRRRDSRCNSAMVPGTNRSTARKTGSNLTVLFGVKWDLKSLPFYMLGFNL
jgi:hypothetical protein